MLDCNRILLKSHLLFKATYKTEKLKIYNILYIILSTWNNLRKRRFLLYKPDFFFRGLTTTLKVIVIVS